MRVLFLGTPEAAVPSLRALVGAGHDVVGVACQPDRPAGRGRAVAQPAVKVAALALGLPVLQPETTASEALRQQVAATRPDVFVVVAYGRILGPKFRALAHLGAINLHFSALPRWRGAAPVARAIEAGDDVTGATIIQLTDRLDAGPVLARVPVPVAPEEHAPVLEARLAEVGAGLLVEVLARGLASEAWTGEPQVEALATEARPLAREESWLDVQQPAELLARRVRAFDPWPGTRVAAASGVLGVLEASVGTTQCSEAPGTFLAPAGEDLPLACGGGSLLLLRRVKPEGRASMTGRSAVNGRFVTAGERCLAPPAPSRPALRAD